MNLRRAALITAISLGLVRAHWIASQAIALIHAFELAGLASLLTNTAFLAPLPVLFVAIYRMHPQLDLTKNLRYAALIIALIQGALLSPPLIIEWVTLLQRNIAEIGMLQERTAATNLRTWLQSAGATALLRNIAMIVSDVAAIQNHRSDRCDRRSRSACHQDPRSDLRRNPTYPARLRNSAGVWPEQLHS